MRKDIDLNTRKGRNLFYQSLEWRALRMIILTEQPFCVECLKLGIHKLAEEVDHIVDIKHDNSKFMDRNNLQALCKSCHSIKTSSSRITKKETGTILNLKWKIS